MWPLSIRWRYRSEQTMNAAAAVDLPAMRHKVHFHAARRRMTWVIFVFMTPSLMARASCRERRFAGNNVDEATKPLSKNLREAMHALTSQLT